jgi:hypothetical protein
MTTTASVHRTANDRTEQLTPDAESLECECECDRAECNSGFEVEAGDYETVRKSGRRFMVAPGHEGLAEDLISTGETYFVIEKLGQQGRLADSLSRRHNQFHGRSERDGESPLRTGRSQQRARQLTSAG